MHYLRKWYRYYLKQIVFACCAVFFGNNEQSNRVGCYNSIQINYFVKSLLDNRTESIKNGRLLVVHAVAEQNLHECPELQTLRAIKYTMQQLFTSNSLLVVVVGGALQKIFSHWLYSNIIMTCSSEHIWEFVSLRFVDEFRF